MAPALGLEGVKEKVLADAVKLAKHVGYRNAGACQGVEAIVHAGPEACDEGIGGTDSRFLGIQIEGS